MMNGNWTPGWDMIGAITAILAFLVYLVVEWDKIWNSPAIKRIRTIKNVVAVKEENLAVMIGAELARIGIVYFLLLAVCIVASGFVGFVVGFVLQLAFGLLS